MSSSRSISLPAAVESKLRQVRARQKKLGLAGAAAIAGSVLLAGMLVAMLADRWLTFLTIPTRMFVTGSVLAATASALAVSLTRRLRATRQLRSTAATIDDRVPQLEERWTTITEVAEETAPRNDRTEAMLKQVRQEAAAMDRLVVSTQVAPVTDVRKWCIILGACAASLLLFLISEWSVNSVLLQRFLAPAAPIAMTRLQADTQDLVVRRGEPAKISATMRGLLRPAATMFVADEKGDSSQIEITPDAQKPELLEHKIASANHSFRYRLQAGDALTDWNTVQVVEPPRLSDVRFKITPPSYTQREPYDRMLVPRSVRASAGSVLTLALKTESREDAAQIILHDSTAAAKTVAVALPRDPEGWLRYERTLDTDLTLEVVLRNQWDFTNDDPPECRITVAPDAAPTVKVLAPKDEMTVRPDDTLEIRFEAKDDYGIAKAELVVYDGSTSNPDGAPAILETIEIPLGDQMLQKRVTGTAKLDLGKYQLPDGANLSYAIRVTDNRSLALAPHDSKNSSVANATGPGNQSLASNADQSSGNTRQQSPAASTQSSSSTSPSPTSLAANQQSATANSEMPQNPTTPGQNAVEQKPNSAGSQPMVAQNSESPNAGSQTPGARNPSAVSPTAAQNANPANSQPSPSASSQSSTPSNSSTSVAKSQPSNTAVDRKSMTPNDSPTAQSDRHDVQVADNQKIAEQATKGEQKADSAESNAKSQPAQSDDKVVSETIENSPAKGQAPPSAGGSASPGSMSAPGIGRLARDEQEQQGKASAESNRMKLTVDKHISKVAGISLAPLRTSITDKLEKIRAMLVDAEGGLKGIVNAEEKNAVSPARRLTVLRSVDGKLEEVEKTIGELREGTQESPYAFIGLQLVDIGMAHVSPARDNVVTSLQSPQNDHQVELTAAWHHVIRAIELLEQSKKHYIEVVRDDVLAERVEQVKEFYSIYVANAFSLLSEMEQELNPLQRKMAVVEADEEYLKRLKEVLEMRQQLMAELARMLADDPRLLRRYMDLVNKREKNYRDQVTILRDRQSQLAAESAAWNRVSEERRPELWNIIVGLRQSTYDDVAREIAELDERVTAQMPLGIDRNSPIAQRLTGEANAAALAARGLAASIRQTGENNPHGTPAEAADRAASGLETLGTDLMEFANQKTDADSQDYARLRLGELRDLLARADVWKELSENLTQKRYPAIAAADQDTLTQDTSALAAQLQGLEGEVRVFIQGDVPEEILKAARSLPAAFEPIIMNQSAATYSFQQEHLADAVGQQAKALEKFEELEKQFDRLRRLIVDHIDTDEVRNLNASDLQDPTLDQILAQLEREPDFRELLGLGRRPSNMNISGAMSLFQRGGGSAAMQQMAKLARQRADDKRRQKPVAEEPANAKKKTNRRDELWNKLASKLEDGLLQVDAKAPPDDYRRAIEQFQDQIRKNIRTDDAEK